MDRNVNTALSFNKETEFVPILGLISEELNAKPTESTEAKASSITDNHHSALLQLLASELSVVPDEIYDFEL